ncbi:hypothetical protein DFJ73DRAFT_225105 [Zopfochytrium polystomum]|nr:hypothetical protein DFJ73DRAFT_225105 [Zopfochytrium polystomum]
MASQATAWTVTFVHDGLGRKVCIPAATDFWGLHQLVCAKFQISFAIELVYVDSATNDAIVLDEDDDLPSLLSQNFKWKVVGAVNSNATGTTSAAAAAVTTNMVENGKMAQVLVDFSSFDVTKFPDLPHAHPLSPGLQSVSQKVKMILDLNGPKVNPESDVMK